VERQDAPWKVVRAFRGPEGSALVHLNNVSGGVLAGDRLRLDIAVEAGASAQITTTGATRLYRHRPGSADSEQATNICVAEGGVLEYLPDAAIPYATSRHAQRTTIRLSEGAALFWWEVIAAGRLAAGERFAFDRLAIHSAIYAEERPVVRDDFVLDPAARNPGALARMGPYSYLATLYAIRAGRPAALWRDLEAKLSDLASQRTRQGEAVWGASALASDGIVVRGLCTSGRFVYNPLIEFWRMARRSITGTDAVPPRKTY